MITDMDFKYYSEMSKIEKWEYLKSVAENLTRDFTDHDYKFSVSSTPDTIDTFIPKIHNESNEYAKAVLRMRLMPWFGLNVNYIPQFNISVK